MNNIEELIEYSMSLGSNKLSCVKSNETALSVEVKPAEPLEHVDNKYDEYGLMNLYGDEKRCSIL